MSALALLIGCAGVDGLSISRVEINPGVSIPLAVGGEATSPEERAAPIPPDRAAWILVHVDVPAGWEPREIEARLQLQSPGGEGEEIEVTRLISRSTEEWAADPAGGWSYGLELDDFEGFAFPLGADQVRPGVSWRVELRERGALGSVALPEDALWELPVEEEGQALRIELQPFALDVEGCQLTADVSEEALEPLLGHLRAIYPLGEVELSEAPALEWTEYPLDRGAMLAAVAESRAERGAPPEVYTYGVLEVCDELEPPTPLGGAITVTPGVPGEAEAPWLAAMVTRVDYEFWGDSPYEQYVFSHELAHLLGRPHAPCGDPAAIDPDYPYPEGLAGDWGIDARSERLFHPDLAHDFMAYCQEMWISRYTWTLLWERMAAQAAGLEGEDARAAGGDSGPLLLGVIQGDRASWRLAEGAASRPRSGEGWLVLQTPAGETRAPAALLPSPEGDALFVSAAVPAARALSARVEAGGRSWPVPLEVLP